MMILYYNYRFARSCGYTPAEALDWARQNLGLVNSDFDPFEAED